MAGFHHGISAQEVVQGILPMRNANTSVLGLIVISTDADDTMYPVGTPVLLTGITQDNIDKAGTDGTLRDCLQTIRDIHNPTVVVLRVSASFEADSLDVLLTCPARFGLMPKRFGAPELDTPDVVLKLVSIAKRRRGIVYASPRLADGTLITSKEDIVAYRDTYGDREVSIIDGEWGVLSEPESSDGSGGDTTGSNVVNFLKLQNDQQINGNDGDVAGLVYSINGGEITAVSRSLPLIDELGGGQSFTLYEFLPELPTGDSFLPFGRDGGFGWNDSDMPSGLDVDKFYLFGINNISWQAFFAMKDLPQPEEVAQGEFVMTIYPASTLPSENIDYDIFDLIIDPSSYTASELAYFSSQGITPATKNPDGSYTIKSQLKVVFAPYVPPSV